MLARKVLIFRLVVLTILLYGCETLDSHILHLEVFQMNCELSLRVHLTGLQVKLNDIFVNCHVLLVRLGLGVSDG